MRKHRWKKHGRTADERSRLGAVQFSTCGRCGSKRVESPELGIVLSPASPDCDAALVESVLED